MSLSLEIVTLPDPDGHGEALALPGDWLVVAVGDGEHVGLGEASHSGNDAACATRVGELFERHLRSTEPSLEAIRDLERGPFSRARDFVTATAVSALDQALYELVAKRAGTPVWRLLAGTPINSEIPVYVTLNRALTARDDEDYLWAVDRVLEMGVRQIKIAPFEAVTPEGDQVAAARRGLDVIRMLRAAHPKLGIRVDCHERFTPETTLALLAEIDSLGLEWLEAPCPIGPANCGIRERSRTPLAAGELNFGVASFVRFAAQGWADVIMPDVKHVGGFGPLLDVCDAVLPFAVAVSPHNPSGDVSTLATLHAAALVRNATSIELPLHSDGHAPVYGDLLRNGRLYLPEGPGWGIDTGRLLGESRKGRTT